MGFVAFITIFLSVYFLGNFYIFWRLFSLFALKHNYIFWIIVFLFSASFFIANLLQHSYSDIFTRFLYKITSYWIGIGLLLAFFLFLFQLISYAFGMPDKTQGYLVLAITAVAAIYSAVNAQLIRVETVRLAAPVNLKIAQITDLHLNSSENGLLKKAAEKTNAINPDVVFITGDFIDSGFDFSNENIDTINSIKAPIFFVTGNHEYYTGIDRVMKLLSATKIKPLRNEIADFNGIQIIGLDDSHSHSNVQEKLAQLKIDKNKYKILLYHKPLEFEAAEQNGINLMLSGHTHNGQILPFNMFVKIFFPRINGLYKINNSLLYVSSGTGTWGPRMRLGSGSQITEIILHK